MASDSEEDILWNPDEEIYSSESEESDTDDLSYVRQWCQVFDGSPAPPRFPFMGNPGVKVGINDFNDPLELFQVFVDDSIVETIVKETNFYAEEFLRTSVLTPQSRVQEWIETSPKEMKLFLALLLYQSIVKKTQEKHMWSEKFILYTPFVASVMKERRFSLIMKFLHFTHEDITEERPTKLKKIYDVNERIKNNFQAAYIPNRDISIDESLMPYQGRLSWKQFIPSKRARFGIKYFQLCESDSGYIWNFLIYTGKGTLFTNSTSEGNIGTKTVITLAKDLLGLGYCITIDNFYSSPELAEVLIQNKTDVFGTVRMNRKNIPQAVKSSKLKKGEIIGFQKGKMCVFKWMDKKPVGMLTTIHGIEMIDVTSKRNQIIKKPSAIVDYNNTMGGVDKADQMISYYPTIRNRQKKYYKKMFRHLIDQSVLNAHVLHQKLGGSMPLLEFRIILVERLVAVNKQQFSEISVPLNCDRLTGRHFPRKIKNTENRKIEQEDVLCAPKNLILKVIELERKRPLNAKIVM